MEPSETHTTNCRKFKGEIENYTAKRNNIENPYHSYDLRRSLKARGRVLEGERKSAVSLES
jgi:hypothetical protein